MVAARRDVVNADSSETAGPDSAHPKTASDKTMGASKATKKGSSMYKLDEGRSPFTDLAIGVLPQLEAVKLETPRVARTGGQSKRISTGAGGAGGRAGGAAGGRPQNSGKNSRKNNAAFSERRHNPKTTRKP